MSQESVQSVEENSKERQGDCQQKEIQYQTTKMGDPSIIRCNQEYLNLSFDSASVANYRCRLQPVSGFSAVDNVQYILVHICHRFIMPFCNLINNLDVSLVTTSVSSPLLRVSSVFFKCDVDLLSIGLTVKRKVS
ncbi:Hypothetical predicted protein [Octopus vulgaris]|uniref:Uncharacterized protein n=1 Tax=Octopus vulgaris TaxID=6645 RepID=A0AA36B6F5_OCTVU|nr:Hypothetical predicted protein [Octopus vulgaris]